jgi:hypothetical protein
VQRVTGIGGVFLRARDPEALRRFELWQPIEDD